ncbi:MAG: type II secretion system protein N [Candidatus Methylomirabilales bacterium]
MRSLWLFNLFLALVCASLLEVLASAALDRPSLLLGPRAATREARPAPPPARAEAEAPPARPEAPPLASFGVILEKDLFRNPYPEPAVAQAPRAAAPLAPLPALIGTIFVGEERKAVMREGTRTEVYGVGQSVAGGTLTEIHADRVTIQRAGGQSEVLLKASIQSGPAPTAAPQGPGRPAPRPPAKAEPDAAVEPAAPAVPPSAQAVPAQEGDQKRYRQEGMTPEERLRRLRETYLERKRARGL